jgi:hypothetical protein
MEISIRIVKVITGISIIGSLILGEIKDFKPNLLTLITIIFLIFLWMVRQLKK